MPISKLTPFLCLILTGCGSFAFYEDTKVAIAIKVDPKAPDPVELSAAYKEGVFALVPVGRSNTNPPTLAVGPVLSDFDVNYGVNAGFLKNRDGDFLYVVITSRHSYWSSGEHIGAKVSDQIIPPNMLQGSNLVENEAHRTHWPETFTPFALIGSCDKSQFPLPISLSRQRVR